MFFRVLSSVRLPHERTTCKHTHRKPHQTPIQSHIKSNSGKQSNMLIKKRHKEFNLMNSRLHQCVTFGQTIETISEARKQWRTIWSPSLSLSRIERSIFDFSWHFLPQTVKWQAQLGTDLDIKYICECEWMWHYHCRASKVFTQNIYSGIKY